MFKNGSSLFFLQNPAARRLLLCVGLLIAFSLISPQLLAEDILHGKFENFRDTLGNSGKSLFLLAEGVAGTLHYLKTRSLSVFIGYPALMIFTGFAF